jgi:hypothetical protein
MAEGQPRRRWSGLVRPHSLIVQHHLPFGRELIECISLAATFDEACSK